MLRIIIIIIIINRLWRRAEETSLLLAKVGTRLTDVTNNVAEQKLGQGGKD